MRHILALLAALVFAVPAAAGTKATYTTPGKTQILVEVADNGDLRLSAAESEDYFLLIGEAFYMVGKQDKSRKDLSVLRIADFATALERMSKASAAANAPLPDLKIEKQGERQMGGRKGTAYKIRTVAKGAGKGIEHVTSDDPALAPTGRGLARFLSEFYVLTMAPVGERKAKIAAQYRSIAALGTPIGGDMFVLESFETAKIDPKRLTLPAKPKTVDEIVAGKW